MRLTRREMNELAVDREKCAARSDAAALDGDRAAADPVNSPTLRAQAKAAAGFARRHAQEYREEAEALREGRIPGEDW
ncbi:hypothetical protein [Streptomyces massasporeus]|jgi:hypothetical protein|uniref:hypothetical protein n=1 Tax=Streptomyces massasporeus TaxID=67324 RepID=UPI00371A51D8